MICDTVRENISYFVTPLYFTPRVPKLRPPRNIEEKCMTRSLKLANNF